MSTSSGIDRETFDSFCFDEVLCYGNSDSLCADRLKLTRLIDVRPLRSATPNKGVNEAVLGEPFPRRVIHGERLLLIQVPFGADGDDFVEHPFQTVIPIPVFFHECINPSLTCRAGGENQYVEL